MWGKLKKKNVPPTTTTWVVAFPTEVGAGEAAEVAVEFIVEFILAIGIVAMLELEVKDATELDEETGSAAPYWGAAKTKDKVEIKLIEYNIIESLKYLKVN